MTGITSSLRTRLVVASLAWIAGALVLTGVVLMVLFRIHVERHFDARLRDHLEEIAAAAEVGEDGRLKLTWEPADPRFKPPLSGWYWEVRAGDRVLRRSASLGDAALPVKSHDTGPYVIGDINWPGDECLRVIVQEIRLPEKDEPLTVLVAGPRREIRADVSSFTRLLAISLAALALALAALAMVQVGYGLRPLATVRHALNEIRLGTSTRIDAGGSPSEVRPLIDEVNALIAEREAKLQRARAEAGDLAHALKTPIAVIANEAARVGGAAGEALQAETHRVQRVVEHHLVRARAAAGYHSAGAKSTIGPVVEDIRFSLGKLHPGLMLTVRVADGAAFAGDGGDLGEMVGNLADNAAKWAVSRVVISALVLGDRLQVSVEDDGPGLAAAARAAALTRGERLDASARRDTRGARGHGLGLSIVAHLAELYGGRLTLDSSPLGGLRAILDLPAAHAAAGADTTGT
jgi:signal transduction histidine kinase